MALHLSSSKSLSTSFIEIINGKMVRTRSSNGQFVSKVEDKVEEAVSLLGQKKNIIRLFLLILVIPFLYHFLVRKRVLTVALEYLDQELGCNCTFPNHTVPPSCAPDF